MSALDTRLIVAGARHQVKDVPTAEAFGLYDPAVGKGSCGVSFIAYIKGRKSHRIVQDGLQILLNLEHRGAVDADPRAGDGAGILVQTPHRFFKRKASELGIALAEPGAYAVGYVFMPHNPQWRRVIELHEDDFESALALVHQRSSTNTFPSWSLAHPYRMICHNGEINTLRGNLNWMAARQASVSSELFGSDITKLWPISYEGQSDTACFDNALEFLVQGGYSLAHAAMMQPRENLHAIENLFAVDGYTIAASNGSRGKASSTRTCSPAADDVGRPLPEPSNGIGDVLLDRVDVQGGAWADAGHRHDPRKVRDARGMTNMLGIDHPRCHIIEGQEAPLRSDQHQRGAPTKGYPV
jgi:glutamate synthase domain-containing protein 1